MFHWKAGTQWLQMKWYRGSAVFEWNYWTDMPPCTVNSKQASTAGHRVCDPVRPCEGLRPSDMTQPWSSPATGSTGSLLDAYTPRGALPWGSMCGVNASLYILVCICLLFIPFNMEDIDTGGGVPLGSDDATEKSTAPERNAPTR